MWLYYCLLSTVIWGFVAIAIKKCANNEPKRIAIMGMLLYHCMMIAIISIISPQIIVSLKLLDMIQLLPGIVIQSMGFYCTIAAIKYGKVAITTSIQKTQVIVTALLGIIVLGEKFTILQLIVSGILVTLSILLAKEKNTEEVVDKTARKKAILYSWGVVVCYGISDFMNKIYITKFQSPLYVTFNYAVIVLIGILVYCLITKQWNYLDIKQIKAKNYLIVQSLLDVSSSIFNRFALLEGNVSVVSIITTSSIIITMLASRWILKEKISAKKYGMILGIFICVLMLACIESYFVDKIN